MKNTHREQFASLMAGLGELYGKPLSPQLIAIYWDGLREYEFDEVKVAINLHVRNPDTGQFMPKIADVVKFLEGNTLTQAMRAWQKVNEAMRKVGTYATVVFDDPIIHAVIQDMGGWQPLGLVSDDEWPFKAREFEKRYQGYKVKPPQSYPRKLIGIFERENNTKGFPSPDPVLIGNQDQALLVYQSAGDPKRLSFTPVGQLVSVKA
jgi:hypothetical protein